MTINELHDDLIQREGRLSDLGFVTPKVVSMINWAGDKFTVGIMWKNTEGTGQQSQYMYGDDIEVVIDRADDFISQLKSPDELAREEFMQSLGRVIDQGREVGVETDVLNPLIATMKRLSENILEKSEINEA